MPISLGGSGSGGGGNPAAANQWLVYWDVTNDQYFLRRYTVDNTGAVTSVDDFELDGVTPYIAGATVRPAPENYQVEKKFLRDDNGIFIRHYIYEDGAVTSSFDTEIDGTTPYVVSGTIEDGSNSFDIEYVLRIDNDSGTKVQFWRENLYQNGALVSSTIVDASGAAYVLAGVEEDPNTDDYEHTLIAREDLLASGVRFKFWRRNLYINGVLISSDLITALGTPYVVVGSEVDPVEPDRAPDVLLDQYYLTVTDAAALDLTDASLTDGGVAIGSLPAGVVGAKIQVLVTSPIVNSNPQGNVRVSVDGSVPTAVLGFQVPHKSVVYLGNCAKDTSQGDPLEVSNFQAIGEAGVTAKLTILMYRRG